MIGIRKRWPAPRPAGSWRPNNKVTFNRWRDCDRCGLPWPESMLRKQNGLLVCPEDWDSPGLSDAMKEPAEPTPPKVWEPDE